MAAEAEDLVQRLLAGEARAAGRVISLIEDRRPERFAVLGALAGRVGRAERLGVTGPPGAGKSTLINAMTRALRAAGRTVGVVAVDPTSPYTGGALLGDRVRMGESGLDAGVFIRSMATRGALGGLARAAEEACDVLDAYGRDVVVIETVGVGQSEVDVARAADCTLVVLSPESGDQVQAMKAGLMEAADVFVVNKADREGADRMVAQVEEMLHLRARRGAWEPPVLRSVALKGEGVEAILEAVARHRRSEEERGGLAARRRGRLLARLRAAVEEIHREAIWADPGSALALEGAADRVASGGADLYGAAAGLFRSWLRRAAGLGGPPRGE
ncbi:MAG: methylmalonyl Co-A mutase-associated GTPase MeaB [Planctomycetes bacterium]|nr:methylmalonyl Co-A mutase-associated GTPase MeaB [Planctomycetota bacterium]